MEIPKKSNEYFPALVIKSQRNRDLGGGVLGNKWAGRTGESYDGRATEEARGFADLKCVLDFSSVLRILGEPPQQCLGSHAIPEMNHESSAKSVLLSFMPFMPSASPRPLFCNILNGNRMLGFRCIQEVGRRDMF